MLFNLKKHSSSQFAQEMDNIRNDLLRMGGLVEKQVHDALESFLQQDVELAQQVLTSELQVDLLEKRLDEECARVLALRQPAAIDLRTIIAVSKCVSELERIGDKAAKIADLALKLTAQEPLSIGYMEAQHIGTHVKNMLNASLDAFARFDADKAIEIVASDAEVDSAYQIAIRSLITFMIDDPHLIIRVLKVMSALRALERIGDHARNVCEQVVYLVKGTDVRHLPIEEMKEIVNKKP
ncbi:phosphate signaling complex protein PhoU [Orrella sp. 11846]|uniref:phosphate signaling complex protein PhoU n=1 Tax=Orrella sp. 11846 TaxID=3409913 RepID=UPI003B5CF30D